jgi:hypothetical protein
MLSISLSLTQKPSFLWSASLNCGRLEVLTAVVLHLAMSPLSTPGPSPEGCPLPFPFSSAISPFRAICFSLFSFLFSSTTICPARYASNISFTNSLKLCRYFLVSIDWNFDDSCRNRPSSKVIFWRKCIRSCSLGLPRLGTAFSSSFQAYLGPP